MITLEQRPAIRIGTARRQINWLKTLSIHRSNLSRALLGKGLVIFIFTGPILIPLLWLSGFGPFQAIATFGWEVGRGFCSYTVKSFEIGGVPMMVCSRCVGATAGMLTTGLLYFYAPALRVWLPQKRLYLTGLVGALFVPWLTDSGLERLGLWQTDHWLMVPTGFLGGAAVVLAPLLFWPRGEPDFQGE